MANPFGNTTSAVVGAAVGIAGADVVGPALERAKQQAWSQNAYRILELTALAEAVAEGSVTYDSAQHEARLNGFDENHFNVVLELAKTAPDVSFALDLWRKGLLGAPNSAGAIATVRHALRKAKIETQWDDAVLQLHNARLSPQEIALGIVRSVIDYPGILVRKLDLSDSNVDQYTPFTYDPQDEANANGFDHERLRALVGSIGLPLAPIAAAQAHFRSILTLGGYYQSVAQSDTRPEWADIILDYARAILSPSDWATAHLKGWRTEDEMRAGAALHGMSAEDIDLLYLIHGRPAAPGQMAIAAARGVDGPQGRPMDRSQFLEGVAQSDIRPEWGPMLWDSRFHYPPLFQLTRLVADGTITADIAAEWAQKQNYAPDVVAALLASWSKGTGGTNKEATAADLLTLYDGGFATEPETLTALEALGYPAAAAQHKVDLVTARRVASARNTAITDIHGQYKKTDLDENQAREALGHLGIPVDSAAEIVSSWQIARYAADNPL